MTPKRQQLLERVAALPEDALDDAEKSVEEILRWRDGVLRLTDDERAAVREGIEEARRGEFVSDDELTALYRRHGG